MTVETIAKSTGGPSKGLEGIYRYHHVRERGDFFLVLGEERGAFLRTKIGKGKRVLDIGCRDGALTKHFADGNVVVGIDIDSEALERAESKIGIETRQVDLNGDWGIEPHSFDAIVAAETVEHLYYPETVFRKAAEVLKPGGMFVGTVPNAFSLKNRIRLFLMRKKGTPLEDPTHINHFTVAELRALLAKHFEDVQIEGYGRYGGLARAFPQQFAFGLAWRAGGPKQ